MSENLLHVIGEKVSYRLIGETDIKFYIRSSSRSDQKLIKRFFRRSYYILTIVVVFLIPLFFEFSMDAKLVITACNLLLFMVWMFFHLRYLLKKYGIETLSVRKNKVTYKRYLNHPKVAIRIFQASTTTPVEIEFGKDDPTSEQARKKPRYSYMSLYSSNNQARLFIDGVLLEKEELKEVLMKYIRRW